MAYTTLGLDIGARAIRYVLCHTDGQKKEITAYDQLAVERLSPESEELDWESALTKLSAWIDSQRKIPLDGIGLSLDPTYALSMHKMMPFNDARVLDQVLPQALADTWKIDENAQLAFEVGEFVKGTEGSETDDEGSQEGGYDIHVVKYPKDVLRDLLSKLKEHQIDPHVAIVSSDAFPSVLGSLVESGESAWCVLDIGEERTGFSLCNEGKVLASRAFKVGGRTIDTALSEAFGMTQEEARAMKEQTGFVALSGTEADVYAALVESGKLRAWEVDIVQLSRVCSQSMMLLLTGIRQTLMQSRAKLRVVPSRMFLVGGGAQLGGLSDWLSQYLGIECVLGLPFKEASIARMGEIEVGRFSIDAAAVAVCTALYLEGKCPLNLRRGELVHKGSLAVFQEKKWILAALVLLVLATLICMTVTKAKAVQAEHDRLRAALEQASEEVFGKKLLAYSQIEREIAESQGYGFIPDKTAFTHFAWISSQVNDNLSDVEMDLNALDIDTQRKIVTFRGEVSGDDGLPKFMQLLEQYECFPNEIQEPKTSKTKDRVAFTLRVEATQCASGGDSE